MKSIPEIEQLVYELDYLEHKLIEGEDKLKVSAEKFKELMPFLGTVEIQYFIKVIQDFAEILQFNYEFVKDRTSYLQEISKIPFCATDEILNLSEELQRKEKEFHNKKYQLLNFMITIENMFPIFIKNMTASVQDFIEAVDCICYIIDEILLQIQEVIDKYTAPFGFSAFNLE
ncbi:MAG: hypothetical protein E7496_09450 [Ruminococcus sp.]|nr:hypothetical protein [Ruminococcus sp.]